jgi:hypothetical protein
VRFTTVRASRGAFDDLSRWAQGRVEGRVERESLEDVLMQWFRRALLAQRTAGLVVDPA